VGVNRYPGEGLVKFTGEGWQKEKKKKKLIPVEVLLRGRGPAQLKWGPLSGGIVWRRRKGLQQSPPRGKRRGGK